jgi:hypothetical protein
LARRVESIKIFISCSNNFLFSCKGSICAEQKPMNEKIQATKRSALEIIFIVDETTTYCYLNSTDFRILGR